MDSKDQNRLAAIKRLLITLSIFGTVTVIFYLIVYAQTRIPQAMQAAIVIGGGVLIIPFGYWLAKRRNTVAVGVITLAGVALAYGVNELTWSGLTAYHVVGGLLLILIAGNLVLPGKWPAILISVSIYWGYLLAVNIFDFNDFLDFNRYASKDLPILVPYAVATNLALILVVFLQLLQILQTRTIRTRLLITFVMIVLVTVIVNGVVSSISSEQSARSQILNQLDSVATLKESEIRTWIESLYVYLYAAMPQQNDPEEIESILTLLEDYPSTENSYIRLYTKFKTRYDQILRETRAFEEIFLINTQGVTVLSTDITQQGAIRTGVHYYEEGLTQKAYIPPYLYANRFSMTISMPVQDAAGRTIGVIGGHISLDKMSEIMGTLTGLGRTGETYLIGQGYQLLTAVRYPGFDVGKDISSDPIGTALDYKQDVSDEFENYHGVQVYGVYHWIKDLNLLLVAEQERAEALGDVTRSRAINMGLTALAVAVALVAGLIATRQITTPLAKLAYNANQIAAGNLEIITEIEQKDEIGNLAKAFNSMTIQLRSLVSGLEQRVAARTEELQQQSAQLQVAAEVAREAASIHELEQLLNLAVNLIRDRFGFYHAGIFLLDERGEYAVLQAATGEAGQLMLERSHRLKVGEVGLVGYVTQVGLSRVAVDVGSDAVHFKNPLLPETRSEVALPLIVGKRIIGALDVQSRRESAFDESNLKVLQTMADQLAVAIENARLFKQMEQTLEELGAVQGRYTHQRWQTLKEHQAQTSGYRYQGLKLEPVEDQRPEAEAALRQGKTLIQELDSGKGLAVPMRLRGEIIGVLNLRFEDGALPPEMVGTFEEVANRLALVLENARLLQEAQGLAAQEQQINYIATQVRRSANMDAILQNTVRELGRALGASRTFIQIGIQPEQARHSENQAHPGEEKPQ